MGRITLTAQSMLLGVKFNSWKRPLTGLSSAKTWCGARPHQWWGFFITVRLISRVSSRWWWVSSYWWWVSHSFRKYWMKLVVLGVSFNRLHLRNHREELSYRWNHKEGLSYRRGIPEGDSVTGGITEGDSITGGITEGDSVTGGITEGAQLPAGNPRGGLSYRRGRGRLSYRRNHRGVLSYWWGIPEGDSVTGYHPNTLRKSGHW